MQTDSVARTGRGGGAAPTGSGVAGAGLQRTRGDLASHSFRVSLFSRSSARGSQRHLALTCEQRQRATNSQNWELCLQRGARKNRESSHHPSNTSAAIHPDHLIYLVRVFSTSKIGTWCSKMSACDWWLTGWAGPGPWAVFFGQLSLSKGHGPEFYS